MQNHRLAAADDPGGISHADTYISKFLLAQSSSDDTYNQMPCMKRSCHMMFQLLKLGWIMLHLRNHSTHGFSYQT